ncbi:MAG TPA: prealbumin-like fold domain-containing protein [Nocardioidaceae bacterium]
MIALVLAFFTLPLASVANAEEGDPALETTTSEVTAEEAPVEDPPAEEPAPDEAAPAEAAPAEEPAPDPAAEEPPADEPAPDTTARQTAPTAPSAAVEEPEPLDAFSLLADLSLLAVVGGFEIDGNIPVDTAGNLDWANTGSVYSDGFSDLTNFSGSSKEFEHPTNWVNGSSGTAPGKSDIGDVYIYNTTIGGDTYSYFGFTRNDTTGTTAYDVEYNQLPNLSASPPRPNRTPGDLLVQIAQQGSTGFYIQQTSIWTLTSDADWDSSCTLVPGYTPAAGWCAFTPPAGAFDGAVSVDGAFAEGVLNLTELFGDTTCVGDFGVMNIRSRSSESLDAALKDWVTPIAVDIEGTCADLTIIKRDDAGTIVPGATFLIEPDPTPGSSATSLTVTDGGQNDPDGTADGIIVINPVEPGEYTVTETATPDGYFFPAQRSQTVQVAQSASAELVFENPRQWDALSATKTATATYDSSFVWDVDKNVDDAAQNVPEGTDGEFTYTIEVTQEPEERSDFVVTGEIDVTNPNGDAVVATLTDELADGTTCDVTASDVDSGAAGLQVSVPAGGATYAYTCAYPEGSEPTDLEGTNTATLTWSLAEYPQTQGHVDDPATAGTDDATATADFTFTVDELTDPTVTVTDTQYAFDPAWTIQAVPAGQTVSKSYTKYFEGTAGTCTTYDNVATLANGEGQTVAQDEESVELCVGSDLDVTKTVVESLTRTYDWSIEKTADDPTLDVDPATGKVTATYDIEVRAGDHEDSGWLMSGTITVENPNDWQDVTLTGIGDVYDGGGTCEVDTSGGLLIPAGESMDFAYTCDFDGEEPVYDGVNTATIEWDAAAYSTPSGSDEGTADVAEADWSKTLVNDSVTVVDDKATPADETDDVELGSFEWTEGFSTIVEHEIELGTEPGTCSDYTNTASVLGVDDVVLDSDHADVQVCWPVDLTVTKTADASYDRTYHWDITKVADDPTVVEVGPDGSATFDYTVEAVPQGYADDGLELSGTITVTNPNDYMPVTVDINDEVDIDGVICEVDDGTDVVVPADGSVDVDYTCDVSGVGESDYTGGTNTATVTWEDGKATGTAPVTFDLDDETDRSVDVYDDKTNVFDLPGVLLGSADWADGVATFSYSLTKEGVAGECTDYVNTATLYGDAEETLDSAQATVTVCEEEGLSVTKTVDAGYERTYAWDIAKVADDPTSVEVGEGGSATFDYTVTATPLDFVDSDWVMEGTITVTNPNGYDAGGITTDVTDLTDVGAECTVPGGTDVFVGPGETVDLSYTCTFEEQPDYEGVNTATATWLDPEDEERSAEGSADVEFELVEETNKTVDVYDDKTDPEGDPVHLGEAAWNEQGAPTEFTYSLSLPGVTGTCTDYPNTAFIQQTGQSAGAEVTVCVEGGLQIDKDVTASFDRTYLWDIDKSVDEERAEVKEGNDPVFGYTVAVTPDGYEDSGWEMAGTITVTNPNVYDGGAITAEVTDLTDVGGGAECTVDGGDEVTIAAGATVELDYSCTFESQPDYDGLNTATASWTGPGGSAKEVDADAEVEFVIDEETDKTIHVYDDQTDPGAEPEYLGEATWNAAGTPTEFTYELTLEGERGEPGRCTEFTNTAWIEETGQEDSVTVVVCRYGGDGGLVVTKTAEASFDRQYEWDITKQVDRTRIEVGPDGQGTATYTVEVTPTGYTDSGWEMTGSVTVHNPNDWADLTIGLEDLPEVGEGVTCTFDEDPEDVVERGSTTAYTYTCTFEGQPEYDGENRVEVDWRNDDAQGMGDRNGSTSASTPVSFQVDQETDKVVTVVDEMADPDTLGEVAWSEGGQPTTFEYSVDLSAAPGQCETTVNVATIVETGQSAEAETVICAEEEILPAEKEKPRTPPVTAAPPAVLPSTGAPAGLGLVSTLAGLTLLLGAWLMLRARRSNPARLPR